MTALNGYPVSVLLAIALHGLIIGAILFFQSASTEVLTVERPPVIKAILVDENPQARNEQIQEEQRLRRIEDQRREEQRREEQRRQAEREQEQERQREEAERQAEQERIAQLERERERERQERERQRQEQEQAERERQREQELAAQRERERQREQELAAQREAEARERAETDAELVAAYTSIIHDLVQMNWSRPPSARNGMTAVLRINLLPSGDIANVEIVRSSGDIPFDRSAERAVHSVGRFTELQGMPSRLFNQNFRSLLLTFRPEDLLN